MSGLRMLPLVSRCIHEDSGFTFDITSGARWRLDGEQDEIEKRWPF